MQDRWRRQRNAIRGQRSISDRQSSRGRRWSAVGLLPAIVAAGLASVVAVVGPLASSVGAATLRSGCAPEPGGGRVLAEHEWPPDCPLKDDRPHLAEPPLGATCWS